MKYSGRFARSVFRDWLAAVIFGLLALHYGTGSAHAMDASIWEWIAPVLHGTLAVLSLYSAMVRRFEEFEVDFQRNRWVIRLNQRLVYDGARLKSHQIVEDAASFNLSPDGFWRTIVLKKKAMPDEMAAYLRSHQLEGGEPSATDNLDGA